jgi:hypothetical protein
LLPSLRGAYDEYDRERIYVSNSLHNPHSVNREHVAAWEAKLLVVLLELQALSEGGRSPP